MKKWVKALLIILVILFISYYTMGWRREWEEENCELIFYKYTFNLGCAGTCSVKCSDEGFPHVDVGFFYPYLNAEEMDNPNLYKRCECDCGGCKEKYFPLEDIIIVILIIYLIRMCIKEKNK